MRLFISGMLQPDSFPTEERDRANSLKSSKYILQENYQSEYEATLIKEKEDVIL